MTHQKTTLNQIIRHNREIRNCKDLSCTAKLLGYKKNDLTLLSFGPLYYHFTIPKKNHKVRHIEAPDPNLKQFQRKLNDYLQSVYYLNKTQASQAYIIKPIGEKDPRNIYTNALKHLGSNYMLNVDFKDFFHQIKTKDVTNIFTRALFNFNKNTAHTLAKICTYKGRLPMGAPTSPALSNIYSIGLDKDLTNWATLHNAVYTRYVDDLCFSSKYNSFSEQDFNEIQNIALKYHLHFNPNKTTYFSKNDIKTVNGLQLNKTVDIDPDYYLELDKSIVRLQSLIEAFLIMNKPKTPDFIKEYKQEVMGKINFISVIEGKQSSIYLDYLNRYYKALEPPEDLLVNWTKFSHYV